MKVRKVFDLLRFDPFFKFLYPELQDIYYRIEEEYPHLINMKTFKFFCEKMYEAKCKKIKRAAKQSKIYNVEELR